MKKPDVSALANASRELLRQGDAAGAESVLAPVFDELKADAAILHLMGLIKKAQRQFEPAERFLRAAIANALTEGVYYNDLGVVLQARGEYGEAARVLRAAAALMPEASAPRVHLVRCLLEAGELADAEREARAYVSALPSADAWSLLSQVQRARNRDSEAVQSAETALKFAQPTRELRRNYAAALERAGRTKDALAVYEGLAKQDLESPDLALTIARALYGDNRKQEAEAVLEQAAPAFGHAPDLHAALARMRWLRGEGARCTALLEAAIGERPADLALRFICADVLHRGGHDDKALAILERSLNMAPDSPALLTAYGIVLGELGRLENALAAFRGALSRNGQDRAAQRNMLSMLQRAGKPDQALALVRGLRAGEPEDQFLIAGEAGALRILGDSGYRRLHDYQAYVRSYDIPAPRGFFTTGSFNASLADALRGQHRANAHPLDQSLHHGTQTGRSLLSIEEPNFKAFLGAVEHAVRDYISALPDAADDPLGRRRSARSRFSGCWSVRLSKGGFQPNHVHDTGWISSAYYAALTPARGEARSGWLKFGEPPQPAPGCEPDHFIEPRVGMLVLFPSYMWHGTIPFDGDERLSVAFDVVPA